MAKCLLTERKQLKAHATGIVPGRRGRLGRDRWGLTPMDVSRLQAMARWSISCLATSGS